MKSALTICRAANITEEEAREALLAYVAQHCCFGKGAARNMKMHTILPSNALHVSASHRKGRITLWCNRHRGLDG